MTTLSPRTGQPNCVISMICPFVHVLCTTRYWLTRQYTAARPPGCNTNDAIESPNSILNPAGAHALATLIMMALKLSTYRSAESAGSGSGAGACTQANMPCPLAMYSQVLFCQEDLKCSSCLEPVLASHAQEEEEEEEENPSHLSSQLRAAQMPGPPREGQLMCILSMRQ